MYHSWLGFGVWSLRVPTLRYEVGEKSMNQSREPLHFLKRHDEFAWS